MVRRLSALLLMSFLVAIALFAHSNRRSLAQSVESNGYKAYLPIILRMTERIEVGTPQVERTIPLPNAYCPNMVSHNYYSDTWYVGDHNKYRDPKNEFDIIKGNVTLLRNHTVLNTIRVGGRPTDISADPSSALTYITNFPAPYPAGRAEETPDDIFSPDKYGRRDCGNPYGEWFDPACINVFDQNNLLKQFDPEYEPFAVKVNPRTSQAYVSDFSGSSFLVTGATSSQEFFVKKEPVGNSSWVLKIEADRVTGNMYYPSYNNGHLYVVNGTTVVDVFSYGGWGGRDIAVDQERGYIYITNSETTVSGRPTNNISVLRRGSHEVTQISSASRSHFVAVDQVMGYAYVTNQNDGKVTVLKEGAFVRNIDVGSSPTRVSVNSRTGYAFVVLQGEDKVAILKDGQFVTKLPAGQTTYDVYADQYSGYTYVINRASEVRYDNLNRAYEACTNNASITVLKSP